MFDFFKKRKISIYISKAHKYVKSNFTPESTQSESGIDSNIAQSEISHIGGVKYSLKHKNSPIPQHTELDTQISHGDNYKFSTVSQVMKNYTPTGDISILSKKLDYVTDKTFVDTLIAYITNRKLHDSDVYKAAQIDRRLFSKMMSDRQYRPSKDTVIALALSLKLDLEQTLDLLLRAGYALSHSNKRDVLIEYFFREKIFKLDDVNTILYNFGQKTIGR